MKTPKTTKEGESEIVILIEEKLGIKSDQELAHIIQEIRNFYSTNLLNKDLKILIKQIRESSTFHVTFSNVLIILEDFIRTEIVNRWLKIQQTK